jgi:hypothetical protein
LNKFFVQRIQPGGKDVCQSPEQVDMARRRLRIAGQDRQAKRNKE